MTPIEFIRQIIQRRLNHFFCPVCRADIYQLLLMNWIWATENRSQMVMKSLALSAVDHAATDSVCAVVLFLRRWTDTEFQA